METAMNNDWNVKRTENGVIDFDHYVRLARAERRMAKTESVQTVVQESGLFIRSTKAALRAAIRFLTFWNIPAFGTATVRAKKPGA